MQKGNQSVFIILIVSVESTSVQIKTQNPESLDASVVVENIQPWSTREAAEEELLTQQSKKLRNVQVERRDKGRRESKAERAREGRES